MMKTVTSPLLFSLICASAFCQDTIAPTEQYVPASEMSAVLNAQKGVVLSRIEYESLRQKAAIGHRQTQSVFDRIQIDQVNYSVVPAEQQATIQLTIQARKLTDKWQSFSIPMGNLNLEEATINGDPALLSAVDDGNAVRIFVKESGQLNMQFRLSTALAAVGADRVAAFSTFENVPQAFSVAAIKGRQLKLNQLDLDSTTADANGRSFAFPYRGKQIQLSWSGGQSSDQQRQLVFVSTNGLIGMSDNDLRWKSQSKVSVFGKAINSIAIRVPSQMEVTSVTSTGLEGWKLEDAEDGNGTRVLLQYRQPFQEDRLIDINAVMPIQAKQTNQIPTVNFLNVTAHSGKLSLQHERQLRLETQTSDGIRHIGTQNDNGKDGPAEVFAFWQQDYSLAAAVRKREREVFVVVGHTLNIADRSATLQADLTIETLNEPLFEIQIPVPEQWTLISATDANSKPLAFEKQNEDQYVVTSSKPIAAGSLWNVSVVLRRDLNDPSTAQSMELPAIVPQDSMLADGQYLITAPVDLDITPIELRSLASADTGLSYRIQSQDFGGRIQIARSQPQISTRSEIRTWMDQRQKSIAANVTVDVTDGTVRELKIVLPKETSSDPRFKIASLAQVPGFEQQIPGQIAISQQSIEVEGDRRVARLVFDRRVVGALTLTTLIQEARNGDDSQLPAPVFKVEGASREAGLISFEASPEQSFDLPTLTLDQDGAAPVDAALVSAPDGAQRRRAFVCQFVNTNYDFQLKESRFETAGVPSAVVTQADYKTVISHDGSMQTSCLANLKTAGLQTLRFRLPEDNGTFLWSTMLNGSPIEVRSDEEGYFVSLPSQPDGLHQLKVVFGSQSSENFSGQMTQHALRFLTGQSTDQVTEIDVLQQNVAVSYPNSSTLVQHSGPFSSTSRIQPTGWLQHLSENLRLPDTEILVSRSWIAALVVLPLFVVATLIIARRWWILTGCVAIGLLMAGVVFSSQLSSSTATTAKGLVMTAEDAMVTNESVSVESAPAPEPTSPPAFGSTISSFEDDFAQDKAPTQLGRTSGGRQSRNQAGRVFLQMPAAGGMGGVGGRGFGGGGVGGGGGGGPGVANNSAGRSAGGSEITLGLGMPPAQQATPRTTDVETIETEYKSQQSAPGSNSSIAAGSDSNPHSGGARLSVSTSVVVPDDFTIHRFSSVDGTDRAPLMVVIQPELRLSAIRWSVAGLILLLAIRLRKSPLASKIWLATLVSVVAVASVPLIPNLWQVIPDGLLIGAAASVAFWFVFSIPACCCRCWTCLKQCRCWTLLRKKPTTVSLLLLSLSAWNAHADEPQQATPIGDQVFIPYESGKPQLLADKVFVPEAQFWKLYRSAYPESQQRPKAQSAVTAAFYTSESFTRVTENKGIQTLKARFVIQTFDANQQIQLPLGQVAIIRSTLDQQPALLLPVEPRQLAVQKKQQSKTRVPKTDFAWQVLIEEPGQHLLDLEFSVSVSSQNSLGSLSLPIRSVPVGSLTFELPEKDLEATVNGRSDQFRRTGQKILIPINRSRNLQIEWRPQSAKSGNTTTLHAQTNTWVRIADEGLHSEVDLSIDPRQGEIAEVNFRLPENWVVRNISGSTVAAWNVDDQQSSLVVSLREPQTSSIAIKVSLYQKSVVSDEPNSIRLPVIAVPQASRDTGQVLVTAGPEFEVRVRSLSGVSQLNPADVVMKTAKGRRVFACRYTRQPAEVTISASRSSQQLTVSSFNAVRLEGQRQLWTTQLSARVSAAPRRQFDVRIPNNFQVLSVEANHLADWYVQKINDQSFLTVQLTSARIGTLNFVINGRRPQPDANIAELTALTMPAAQKSESWVSVWPDAATQIGSITAPEWRKPRAGESIPKVFTKLDSTPPELTLTSEQTSPADIKINLADAKGTLLAESVTVSNVTDTAIELTLALNWQVTNNAARQVSVALPSDIAQRMRFKADGLSRQQLLPDGESTVVTFHLQQPATDQVFVMGTAAIPHSDPRTITAIAPEFRILANENNELLNQSHFWVLVNQSSAVLEADASADSALDVTPDEIRTSLPQGFLQQSVSIQRIESGQPASVWQMKFPTQQEVSPAVITLAEHRTVLTETGQWRSHHKLSVRNESRQFLPVRLPPDSRFLLCQIDGAPVRIAVSSDPDDPEQILYRIPIPQRGQLAASLNLEFALAGQIAIDMKSMAGRDLQIPQPTFPEFRDSPEFGVTVVRNTWSVFLPETWSAKLNGDPRITNVTAAVEADFEDAELMAAAESLQQIIKSLSTSKDKFTGGTQVIMELERQQDQLNRKAGNRRNVEEFRNRVLQEAGEAIESNIAIIQQTPVLDGVMSGANPFGNSASQNWFLENRELQRNGYNSSNQLELFMDNSSNGIMSDPNEEFRILLPEDQSKATEVEQLRESLKRKNAVPVPGQNRPSIDRKSSKAAPAKKQAQSFNKSQLLGSLQQNAKGLPANDMYSGKRIEQESRSGRQEQAGAAFGVVPRFSNSLEQSNIGLIPNQQTDGLAVPNLPMATNNLNRSNLLSLNFQIPQAGVRHNFVRAGGNATLTMTVRPQSAVTLMKGVAWAAGILLAGLFVLRGLIASPASGIARLLLIGAIFGFVGSLLLAGPASAISALAAIGCAVVLACLQVVRSFIKPAAT